MPIRKILVILCLFLTVLCLQLVGFTASARIISLTQLDITSETNISNTGTLVVANSLGATPLVGTINSVNFGTDQSGLGNFFNDAGNFSNQFSNQSGLDRGLSDLVLTLPSERGSLTLGGLAIGNTYRLQLLFSNTVNSVGDDTRI
jgi:hypothetical protein